MFTRVGGIIEILVILIVYLTNGQWEYKKSMSTPSWGMSVGHYQNTIYLLDGYGTNRVLRTYDIDTNTYSTTTSFFSPAWLDGEGQNYVQIGNILYIISDEYYASDNNHDLYTFDLSTNTYNAYWYDMGNNLPRNGDYKHACLAGYQDTLYLIGGRPDYEDPQIQYDYLYLLKISTQSWSSGPSLNIGRSYFSCIVSSNEKLYAISGYLGDAVNTNTVEYISINNINSNSWSFTPTTFTTALWGTRAVQYGDIIYVIGGAEIRGGEVGTSLVHTINTITNQVSLSSHSLLIDVIGASSIQINGIIYAFGGIGESCCSSTMRNTLQTYTLATTTSSPTTSGPTPSPTTNPTPSPTNIPTAIPTSTPTRSPSDAPSMNPTISSTVYCTQSNPCICPPTQECVFNCEGNAQCADTVLYPAFDGQDILIQCLGPSACFELSGDLSSANSVTLECKGANACIDANIISCTANDCQTELNCLCAEDCITENSCGDDYTQIIKLASLSHPFRCTGLFCITPKPTDAPHTPGTPSSAPSEITPSPSETPTINPTQVPSFAPSEITQSPLNAPTVTPITSAPTVPTLSPSQLPTVKPVLTTLTPSVSPIGDDEGTFSSDDILNDFIQGNTVLFILILIGMALLCCIPIAICCYCYKARELKRKVTPAMVNIAMATSSTNNTTSSNSNINSTGPGEGPYSQHISEASQSPYSVGSSQNNHFPQQFKPLPPAPVIQQPKPIYAQNRGNIQGNNDPCPVVNRYESESAEQFFATPPQHNMLELQQTKSNGSSDDTPYIPSNNNPNRKYMGNPGPYVHESSEAGYGDNYNNYNNKYQMHPSQTGSNYNYNNDNNQMQRQRGNTDHYSSWNHEEICNWILSLHHGVFMKYQRILRQTAKDWNLKGSDIPKINGNDIIELGIKEFEHKKLLQYYFTELINSDKYNMTIEGGCV